MSERTRSPRGDQLPIDKSKDKGKDDELKLLLPAPSCPTGMPLPPELRTPEWMLNSTWPSGSTYTEADTDKDKDKDKEQDREADTDKDKDKVKGKEQDKETAR